MAKEHIAPMQLRHELARKVIAVAHPLDHDPKLWLAYIDAVPGKNHNDEEEAVLALGSKLRKTIACALFPHFNPRHYAAS